MELEFNLRRYLNVLWRWLWLFCLAALVSGGVAYWISQQQRPLYEASTTILIEEAPGTNSAAAYQSVLTSERRARTYSQLLTAEPLLQSVIQKLQLSLDAAALREAISVNLVRDTQLISIQVQDYQPQQAASIANTLVSTFAAQTQQLQATRYDASKQNLKGQMTSLENQIADIGGQLATLGDSAADKLKRERLEESQSQYRQSYANLLQSFEQVRLAEAQATSSVAQVEPAVAPVSPVGPRILLNTLLAAVLGIVVTIGLVIAREALDDSVKNPELIAQQCGLPILGLIGRLDQTERSAVVAITRPRSPVAEEFRMLRTNIHYASVDRKLRTLLVTSAEPGAGKSTVVTNIGAVLAQTGRRVLLVDGDLRRPSMHTRLSIPNRDGLSELFMEARPHVNGQVRRTGIVGVSALTSGAIPPNPAELLGSVKMDEILTQLRERADVVVLDAPPVLAVTDAVILSERADGVVIVVRAGQTKHAALKRTIKQLQHAGANILGLVINDVQKGQLGYGYGSAYAQYEYHPQPASLSTRAIKWLRLPGSKTEQSHVEHPS